MYLKILKFKVKNVTRNMKLSIFELQLHNIGNKIHFILRFEIKN